MIKEGLFSFSYYQFTIFSNELQSKCKRKLSDFEWLREKLVEFHPGLFIPPFPSSSLFEKNTNSKISKKLRTMNKFMDSLFQNELIRSSKLFTDFITLRQDQFEQFKKDINKNGPPTSILDIVTLDGRVNISISKEKEMKAIQIASDYQIKCELLDDLTKCIKNLNHEFGVLSVKFSDVSNAFDALAKAYSKTPNCKSMEKSLESLTNLTNQWSKGYLEQKEFFKEEIKEFFKFISTELYTFDSLYTEYNNAFNYYNDNIQSIENAETLTSPLKQEYISSKRYYGFLLNRFLDEYARVNSIHSERVIKQFLQYNDKKNILLSDYINLLNLLSLSN